MIWFRLRAALCDAVCAPEVAGLGVDAGRDEIRWTNSDRARTCIIQYTTGGHGVLEHDLTKERWQLPVGTLFLLNTPAPLTYIKPPGVSWESLWVCYEGEAARRLSDGFIARYGNVVETHENSAVISALVELYRCGLSPHPSPFLASRLLYNCLITLGEHLASGGRPVWVARACRSIERSAARGKVDLESIALESGLSRFHFTRRFHQHIGMSPHRYFTACRMNRARELIQTTDHPIREIGRGLGFEDYAYFCRAFRRFTGITPGSVDRPRQARRGRRLTTG
jgi:AraC-like DNA-binding protein